MLALNRWVLLKNVHLAPQWLMQLEKKLHSLQAHPNFRLFLTMEINPKVTISLYYHVKKSVCIVRYMLGSCESTEVFSYIYI